MERTASSSRLRNDRRIARATQLLAALAAAATAAFAAAAAHATKHTGSSGSDSSSAEQRSDSTQGDSAFAPSAAPQTTLDPPVATSGGS